MTPVNKLHVTTYSGVSLPRDYTSRQNHHPPSLPRHLPTGYHPPSPTPTELLPVLIKTFLSLRFYSSYVYLPVLLPPENPKNWSLFTSLIYISAFVSQNIEIFTSFVHKIRVFLIHVRVYEQEYLSINIRSWFRM